MYCVATPDRWLRLETIILLRYAMTSLLFQPIKHRQMFKQNHYSAIIQ